MSSVFQNIPGAVARIRAQLSHDDLIAVQQELENTISGMEQQVKLHPRIDAEAFEKGTVKERVSIIQEAFGAEGVEAASIASSLYSSRKSFGSSIFGTMPTFTPGSTPTTTDEEA